MACSLDFTLTKYRDLIECLLGAGYQPITFAQYCHLRIANAPLPTYFVVLRHDVDKRPMNSETVAAIEKSLDVKASYFFRVVSESNDPQVIRVIAQMGHEIGYHYEDMSLCHGHVDEAYNHFVTWLDYFRRMYPVETICMHGAPTSKWDGRELWNTHDYHALGLIGEPYKDVDFCDVFYLTDTGRRWDGWKVSLRDKIPVYQDEWVQKGLVYHSTDDIMNAIRNNTLPNHIMITTHPQRWTENRLKWFQEWILQGMKNIAKRILVWIKR